MTRLHRQSAAFGAILCAAALAAQALDAGSLVDKKKLGQLEAQAGKKIEQAGQAAQTAASQLPPVKQEERISLLGDLSDADEQALGRETAGRLLAAYPVVRNDSLQRYVNMVGVCVAQRSPRANLAWTFAVIESADINAFSLPGGYVLVTGGLYRTLRNEAELAAVLGHEIAHVNLRHQVRLMQKERLIAQGRDFVSGMTKHDALKALAGTGAEIAARSLDKEAEFDADRTGIEYAARAGYDPFAYLDLLDRLGADNQTDRLSLLFKTHPHPRDRMAALENAMGTKWNGVGGVVPGRWVALQ